MGSGKDNDDRQRTVTADYRPMLFWRFVPFALFLNWLLCSHLMFPSFFYTRHVKGQNVLLTGASQGIGKSLVFEYAKRGANHIVIAARNKGKLDAVRTEVMRQYPAVKVTAIQADLSSESKCKRLIQKALGVLGKGGLDTLLLNHITFARFGTWLGDAPKSSEGQSFLTEMFTVNTFSYIWLATAAMPALKINKGFVGVVSSLAGYVGTPKTAMYSSTKHALHGFFNALRAEMAMEKDNKVSITVCAIGPTDTEGVEQVKSKMNKWLFWDPPSGAAEGIVRGVVARQREVFHPHYVVFPAVQIYHYFPGVLDMVLIFFVKN